MKTWQSDYNPTKDKTQAQFLKGHISVMTHKIAEIRSGISCLHFHGTTPTEMKAKEILQDKLKITLFLYNSMVDAFETERRKEEHGEGLSVSSAYAPSYYGKVEELELQIKPVLLE